MPAILFLLFIVVPVLELLVIIQVGQALGPWPTAALLVAISLVGAALVKREGLKAWWRFNETVRAGGVPAAEVVDGALVLFGGALLLTPGFLTDALGLALIVPVTRMLLRRFLRKRTRLLLVGPAMPGRAYHRPSSAGSARRGATPGGGEIVDVEVVRVERERPGEAPESHGLTDGDDSDRDGPRGRG